MTEADAALLVADDDESCEAEATATLDHLGDAIDVNQLVDDAVVALGHDGCGHACSLVAARRRGQANFGGLRGFGASHRARYS